MSTTRSRLVYIATPALNERPDSDSYLHDALADAFSRGEALFSSHALAVIVAGDDDLTTRARIVAAGCDWLFAAQVVAAYVDLGVTAEMQRPIEIARRINLPVEERRLPGWT